MCPFSHGWKEQQFHPMIFKTLPCEEPKCFKGFECPFYHSAKDKRVIKANLEPYEKDRFFIPAPGRSLKTIQQPNLMELYFDNNLNHIREQLIAHPELEAEYAEKENNKRIKLASK